MNMPCSYSLFWDSSTAVQKCAALSTNECSSTQSLLDFFKFYWCHMDGDFAGLFFLLLFFLIIVLKTLSNLKNEALFPATLNLLDWLHVPKAISSLTFLPFVAISLEFFVLLAASSNNFSDSYAFPLLYTEIVAIFGLILPFFAIFFKQNVEISGKGFVRDAIFLVMLSIFWIIVGSLQEISLVTSLLYLCFYVLYVLVVAYQNKENFKEVPPEAGALHLENADFCHLREYEPANALGFLLNHRDFREKLPGFFVICHTEFLRTFGIGNKFMKFFDLPYEILRKFALPPVLPGKYNKLDMLLWPIPTVFLLAWGLCGWPSFYWFYIISPIACCLFFIVLLSAPETEKPDYFPALQILSWLCSATYMYRLCQLLIDALQIIQVFTGLGQIFFSVFLLALVFVLQTALFALKLAEKTEVVACLWGSSVFLGIFAMIFALGVANLVRVANFGTINFALFESKNVILGILLLGTLVGVIFWGCVFFCQKKFKITTEGLKIIIIWAGLLMVASLIAGIVIATENS